jgi:hypothetical protein
MGDDGGHLNISKINIPYFNPDEDKISAKAWIYVVEMAATSAGTRAVVTGPEEARVTTQVARWTDEITCTNAMLLLQGSASKWLENLLSEGGDATKSWKAFKKVFKKRFIKSLSLTEKLNLMDLKMKSTESCDDFYDRCKNNYNQFFEDEWEVLEVGKQDLALPWGNPNTIITEAHVLSSTRYYLKCKAIQMKLAFAAGLRENIKKQTLIQPADNLDSILEVAQRVEASLKELKKEYGVASCEVDEDEDDDSAEVGAINNQKSRKFQKGGAGRGNTGGPNRKNSPPNKSKTGSMSCYYCLKTGHFKPDCMTRKNDRAKGIFKSNINAKVSKGKSISNVDADDDDEDDEGGVSNCMVDFNLTDYLNLHSA